MIKLGGLGFSLFEL